METSFCPFVLTVYLKTAGEKVKVTEDDHLEAKAIVVVSAKYECSYQYLLDDKKWVRINKYPQLVGDICGIYEINNKIYVVDKKGISTLDNEFYKLHQSYTNSDEVYGFCASCQTGNNILVYQNYSDYPAFECKMLDLKNQEVVDCNLKRSNNYSTYFAIVHYFNQFWIIGGMEDNDENGGIFEPVNKIQIYDPVSKTTSLSSVKMIQARRDQRAIVYKDKLFVFGGKHNMGVLNSVEMYSPETNKFKMMAPMKYARSNFACCRVENLVYVISGSYKFPKSMEVYNLDTNVWTDGVDSPGFKLNLYACAVNDYIC